MCTLRSILHHLGKVGIFCIHELSTKIVIAKVISHAVLSTKTLGLLWPCVTKTFGKKGRETFYKGRDNNLTLSFR